MHLSGFLHFGLRSQCCILQLISHGSKLNCREWEFIRYVGYEILSSFGHYPLLKNTFLNLNANSHWDLRKCFLNNGNSFFFFFKVLTKQGLFHKYFVSNGLQQGPLNPIDSLLVILILYCLYTCIIMRCVLEQWKFSCVHTCTYLDSNSI